MAEHEEERWRIALRGEPRLDDVVVHDVSTFHAEMLDSKTLWLACYLPGTGVEGDRITFEVTSEQGGLVVRVAEQPGGQIPRE